MAEKGLKERDWKSRIIKKSKIIKCPMLAVVVEKEIYMMRQQYAQLHYFSQKVYQNSVTFTYTISSLDHYHLKSQKTLCLRYLSIVYFR